MGKKTKQNVLQLNNKLTWPKQWPVYIARDVDLISGRVNPIHVNSIEEDGTGSYYWAKMGEYIQMAKDGHVYAQTIEELAHLTKQHGTFYTKQNSKKR